MLDSFFEKTAKYLKTDTKYLAEGGFWLVIGHTIHVASNLLLAVAFANLLSKESYGTYQFILAMAAVISTFTLSGIGIAAQQAVASGKEHVLRYSFRIKLLWSSGITVACGAIGAYYLINDNATLGYSFLIAGATIPFIESFSLYRSYLLGKGLFKETATLGLWRKPLTLISILITLYFTNEVTYLIAAYYLSSLVSLGMLYALTIKKYDLQLIPSKSILKYSQQISLLNVLRAAANHADKIIIFQFLGAAQVAIFVLAQLPLSHLQKSLGLIGKLAFPKFAKHDFLIVKNSMWQKLIIFFAATLPLIGIYILLAPYFYKILFPLYTESIFYSQILILALLFKPTTLINKVFESQKMVVHQQISLISTLVFQISATYLMIALFGLWGAVIAVLATNSFWAIVSLGLFYWKK